MRLFPARPAKVAAPTRRPALLRRVLGSRRGASASEFAIIAGPFFVLVLGTIEVAWQLATGMALDHASLRASRFGMTGSDTPPGWMMQNQQNVPTCRSANIRWMITRATNGLLKDNSNLLVTTNTWSSVNATRGGGGAAGAGTGGQIVSYTVTYNQPFVTGLVAQSLWGGNSVRHQTFLVVKNEPFENATC
jgi:Flp pilus assembly protein TadG